MKRKDLYSGFIHLILDQVEKLDFGSEYILVALYKDNSVKEHVQKHDLHTKYCGYAFESKVVVSPMPGLLFVSAKNLSDKSFFEKFVTECARIDPQDAFFELHEMAVQI